MMMRLLIKSLREQIEITTSILTQMKTIAESIPEYGVVREMSVWEIAQVRDSSRNRRY